MKAIAPLLMIAVLVASSCAGSNPTTVVSYNDGRPLALSRAGIRKEGLWAFLYADGAPFAIGRFVNGRCSGPWLVYTEDGILMASSGGVLCDGEVLGIGIPNWDLLSWNLFDHAEARSVLPGIAEGWLGQGYYEDGHRTRSVTVQEKRDLEREAKQLLGNSR